MKSPRTDGLYLMVDADNRRVAFTDLSATIRFFDDGSVMVGSASDPKEWWKRPQRLPTKGWAYVGDVPVPYALDGAQIAFTADFGWSQTAFTGTWSPEHLELRVAAEGGPPVACRYAFFPEAAVQKPIATAPLGEQPSATPPADARTAFEGVTVVQLAAGDGDSLGEEDTVGVRFAKWRDTHIAFDFRPVMVKNLLGGSVFARVGDSYRTWWTRGSKEEIEDITVVTRYAPGPQRRDGLFVGPDEDGQCTVIRFIYAANRTRDLYACAARVPTDKLSSALKFTMIATVKDLFMIPAPFTTTGDRLGWVSLFGRCDQTTFEGTWSETELVLDEVRRTTEHVKEERKAVRYTHLSADEVTVREKAAKKAKRAAAK